VELLARAIPDSNPSKNLARLLSKKSLAGYSPTMLTNSKTTELVTYAERLVAAMDAILDR
jgi:hypothetical protein